MVSELAFASLGFGPALLYEISWQLFAVLGLSGGDLEEAVANIVVIEIPCGIAQMVTLRRNFRPRLTVIWNLPFVVALPVGTIILEHYGKNAWMKRALGVFFLSIVALQVYQRKRTASARTGPGRPVPKLDEEPRAPSTLGAMWVALAFSGLSRGLFGVAGPPVMVLMMCYGFAERDVWRCISTTNRLVTCVVQGAVLASNSDVNKRCWPMYAALMVGGLVGLGLGNLAAPLVDANAFQRWLILFLAAGAALLICTGFKTASAAVALLLGLIFLVAALLPVATALRQTAWGRWRSGPRTAGIAGSMDGSVVLTEAVAQGAASEEGRHSDT